MEQITYGLLIGLVGMTLLSVGLLCVLIYKLIKDWDKW